MNRHLPEEIRDAIEMLETFDNLQEHGLRAGDYENAIEILNAYLTENPGSPHINFIKNIKLTYTRKLLEQLPKLHSLKFSEWLPYMMPLIYTARNEIDLVIERYPNLAKHYKKFLAIWMTELIKRMKELDEIESEKDSCD